MATVYLATDLKHNREVALKVLRPELGAVLGVERFLAYGAHLAVLATGHRLRVSRTRLRQLEARLGQAPVDATLQ